MKNFIISIMIIWLLSITVAFAGEYTATNALSYTITKSVDTADGPVIGLSVEGVWSDSRGNSGTIHCVGTRGKILKAYCNSIDQDGDIQYNTAKRVGTEGKGVFNGGTGKYANVTGGCSYQVAAFDKNNLIGLITLQCYDNLN